MKLRKKSRQVPSEQWKREQQGLQAPLVPPEPPRDPPLESEPEPEPEPEQPPKPEEEYIMAPPMNVGPYAISMATNNPSEELPPPQIVTSPSHFPLQTDMVQGQTPQPMNPSN